MQAGQTGTRETCRSGSAQIRQSSGKISEKRPIQNLRPREGAVSGEKVLMSKLLLKTTPPKALVYTMARSGSNRTHFRTSLLIYRESTTSPPGDSSELLGVRYTACIKSIHRERGIVQRGGVEDMHLKRPEWIPASLFRILSLSLALHCCLYGAAANVALEDQVAKAVLSIRAEAHLPKLTRIKHREELQAWTCMAAERDTSMNAWIFKTDVLLSSPQLRETALTVGNPKGGDPAITRFAVAAWGFAVLGRYPHRNHIGLE
jgi:hypothetical protein